MTPDAKPTRSPHDPMVIRPAVTEDLAALRLVIDATDLFPSDMLGDMMAGYFTDDATQEMWFTCDDGGPIAVAYCAPERMTSGTWNLYLLAVHPDHHGKGVGAAVMRHVEGTLAAKGERLLLVETSGAPAFEGTRAFYRACGYEEEAHIRDFYQAGEGKVVFRKALATIGRAPSSTGT